VALSIGVGTGSRVDVDGHVVKVKNVVKPNLIVLTVDGGEDIVVSDQARIEILPDVFVFAGVGSTGRGSRLAFEAPVSIPIHRIGYEVVEYGT